MQTVVLENLTIGYATKGQEKVVAKGLNAAINSGQLTCLLGQNGIGKSTLLRTLSAFQPKLGGNIKMEGREIAEFTDKELSRIIWGGLTDEDHAIVRESIQLVGIESLSQRMVHTLSDGERQKVMIAKALAQQTPIIYLDEPTAFLDYPSKVETMQLLRRLAIQQQKTIFLSTHDVELSLQVADCIWLMEPDMLSMGTPRELAAQGALSRFIERADITFDKETLQIRVLC